MSKSQWMSVELMNKFVPLAQRLGVSEVARRAGGFVPTYRRAGSPKRMSDHWIDKRAGFVARHVAQGKKEGWWKDGEPTRRHLALIMWAYTPTPSKTLKYANDRL